MIICVALDDNNGMLFNNRRQSKDRFLRNELLNTCDGSRLWMNEYTSKQFEEPLPDNIIIDVDFLNKATESDYCFVENLPLAQYIERIDKLIIYRWNRVYPADMHFDISLEAGWRQLSVTEFEGNSHKQITKEVWVNEN